MKTGKGLSLLFDLSATPKDQNSTFFPWIISDYPLAQAIEDKIVKTPLIVHQSNKKSPDNKKITNAYSAYVEWINIALKSLETKDLDTFGRLNYLFRFSEEPEFREKFIDIKNLYGWNWYKIKKVSSLI